MGKFSDYLASEITPQNTLVEKFNALLKYLDKVPLALYQHKVKFQGGASSEIIFVDFNPTPVASLNEFISRFNSAIYRKSTLIEVVFYCGIFPEYDDYLWFFGANTTVTSSSMTYNFSKYNVLKVIVSDEITDYEV